MNVTLGQMIEILDKEKHHTMFYMNEKIWYKCTNNFVKGRTINIGGGNPDTERPLSYLKGKKVVIPKRGHIWRPFKPFHYWDQCNAGEYQVI